MVSVLVKGKLTRKPTSANLVVVLVTVFGRAEIQVGKSEHCNLRIASKRFGNQPTEHRKGFKAIIPLCVLPKSTTGIPSIRVGDGNALLSVGIVGKTPSPLVIPLGVGGFLDEFVNFRFRWSMTQLDCGQLPNERLVIVLESLAECGLRKLHRAILGGGWLSM